jgi:ribosomal protein S27AE
MENKKYESLYAISNLGRCPECGVFLEMLARPYRAREMVQGVYVDIPEDFPLPTCPQCGDYSMIPEVSEPLDKILWAEIPGQRPLPKRRGLKERD